MSMLITEVIPSARDNGISISFYLPAWRQFMKNKSTVVRMKNANPWGIKANFPKIKITPALPTASIRWDGVDRGWYE